VSIPIPFCIITVFCITTYWKTSIKFGALIWVFWEIFVWDWFTFFGLLFGFAWLEVIEILSVDVVLKATAWLINGTILVDGIDVIGVFILMTAENLFRASGFYGVIYLFCHTLILRCFLIIFVHLLPNNVFPIVLIGRVIVRKFQSLKLWINFLCFLFFRLLPSLSVLRLHFKLFYLFLL
jgi:hypothetical protein